MPYLGALAAGQLLVLSHCGLESSHSHPLDVELVNCFHRLLMNRLEDEALLQQHQSTIITIYKQELKGTVQYLVTE